MKKWINIVFCLLLIGCSTKEEPIEEEDICSLENNEVCYVEDDFLIEDNAQIEIGNLPLELQQAIVDLWNTTYPNHKGLIKANRNGELSDEQIINSLLYDDGIDIIYAEENVLTYYIDHLYALSEELELKKSEEYQIEIENYYVPYTIDGIAFLYNKTMLEEFGLDMETDSDNDGLPDCIDDYDKIFTLSARYSYDIPVYKKKQITTILPLCFNEQTLSYYMISAGFKLFPTLEGDKPGFDSDEFKTALEFIYNAGKFPLARKQTTETIGGKKTTVYNTCISTDHIWQWESVYTNEIAPFGIVTSFMDIDSPMSHHGSELIISRFPTYRGEAVTSLVTYQGFAIESDTEYPSAAHAVMKFLKSEAVMQLLLDYSDRMPYLYDGMNLDFRGDENRYRFTSSLMEATHIPLLALPDNIYQEAMEYYYDGDYMSILMDLFDHKINVSEAQQLFIKSYDAWYKEKTTVKDLSDEKE